MKKLSYRGKMIRTINLLFLSATLFKCGEYHDKKTTVLNYDSTSSIDDFLAHDTTNKIYTGTRVFKLEEDKKYLTCTIRCRAKKPISTDTILLKTSAPGHMYLIAVPVGAIYELILPDKTGVSLNSGSMLMFPGNIAENHTVKFKGEASFNVERNYVPLTIVTEGSRFVIPFGEIDINTFNDVSMYNAGIISGIAQLKTEEMTSQLVAPCCIKWKGSDVYKSVNCDPTSTYSWRNGKFAINPTENFHPFLKTLERWYDVKFTNLIIPDLANPFTGGIPLSATLNDILALMRLNKIKYKLEMDGNKLQIEIR